MRRTVIIMVKAPEVGRAKTRLGRTIGMGRAAFVFRHLLRTTIVEAVSIDWETIVAIEPRGRMRAWRHLWPRSVRVTAQTKGDLGARMAAAIDAAPNGPVAVIGADAPGLRRRHLRQAFSKLGRADAVFGPAEDGGYWLIGLARRRRAPDLFEGVRWSTSAALEDTRKSLPAEFVVAQLEKLRDIDEAEDLTAMTPRARQS